MVEEKECDVWAWTWVLQRDSTGILFIVDGLYDWVGQLVQDND